MASAFLDFDQAALSAVLAVGRNDQTMMRPLPPEAFGSLLSLLLGPL